MTNSNKPTGAAPHFGTAHDFQRYFSVSRETIERLETYERLLRKWQKAINLVAPGTMGELWHRHFADSAQLMAHVPPAAGRLADLGSGAGFPGLVLAVVASDPGATGRPGLRVTMIESDTRKVAFLREVARSTGIVVDIIPHRIESDAIRGMVERIDCVTSRALAPLPRLLALAAPLFGTGTVGIFPKGRDAEAEISAARQQWNFRLRVEQSLTEAEARIVIVQGLVPREGS